MGEDGPCAGTSVTHFLVFFVLLFLFVCFLFFVHDIIFEVFLFHLA